MNLMQYLSVGGALESPREKHFSRRRIGSKKSEPADAVARESARMEPVMIVESSRLEDDQGEFGLSSHWISTVRRRRPAITST